MKKLITLLTIALFFTAVYAQSECEAIINGTMNETTATFEGLYFVNGQQVTEPAMVNFSWTIDNTTLEGQMVTWTFEPGLHMVCLTASGYGCTATVCDSVFAGGPIDSCYMYLDYDITMCTDANTNDGAIDITVFGGTAPYSYVWNTGQVSEDLTNLYPGVYTVAVNDAAECGLTWTFEIPVENNDSTIYDTVFNNLYAGAYYYFETEEDCSAVVMAEAYGGTAPYTYNWSNLATTSSFTGGCGGDFYCVTITDAEGETAEACVFLQFYNNGQDSTLTVNDSLEIVINNCLGYVANASIVDFIIEDDYIIVTWEFIGDMNSVTNITVTYFLQDVVSEGIYILTLYVNCGDLKAISAYQDQIVVTSEDITGIQNILQTINPGLYPNPVSDVLNVEINSSNQDDVTISIYNYNGQQIISHNSRIENGTNTSTIDVSQLPAGFYFVKISGNQTYETMKFVK